MVNRIRRWCVSKIHGLWAAVGLPPSLSGSGTTMENPYQSPATSVDSSAEGEEYHSFADAAKEGVRTAIRWTAVVVAPILAIVFVGIQVVFVYRGLTVGIWPGYSAPQFWYSMVVLVLLLLGAFVVACSCVGFLAISVYLIRHIMKRRIPRNSG